MHLRHHGLTMVLAFAASAVAVIALIGFQVWTSYSEAILTVETTSSNYGNFIEGRFDATFRRAEGHVVVCGFFGPALLDLCAQLRLFDRKCDLLFCKPASLHDMLSFL